MVPVMKGRAPVAATQDGQESTANTLLASVLVLGRASVTNSSSYVPVITGSLVSGRRVRVVVVVMVMVVVSVSTCQ